MYICIDKVPGKLHVMPPGKATLQLCRWELDKTCSPEPVFQARSSWIEEDRDGVYAVKGHYMML